MHSSHYTTKMSAFQEQKMSKSAKAKVNDQLAIEWHQLPEQMIDNIHAAMEVLVYWTEKVTLQK